MEKLLATIRARNAGLKIATKAALRDRDKTALRHLAKLHRLLLTTVESAIALCDREMAKANR
jgi:hypothetical protein